MEIIIPDFVRSKILCSFLGCPVRGFDETDSFAVHGDWLNTTLLSIDSIGSVTYEYHCHVGYVDATPAYSDTCVYDGQHYYWLDTVPEDINMRCTRK